MKRLSQELITEILARMPPRGLLRMRCLSRSYCSLIDGENFIKLHLHHSLGSGARQAVIFRNKDQLEYQLVDDPLAVRPTEEHLPLPLDLADEESLQSRGSCHGLVALSDCDDNVVVIWNPNTRKHRILPSRDPFSHILKEKRITTVAIGFGYDSSSDDYKVVELAHLSGSSRLRRHLPRPEVRVYSFKSDKWRWISEEVLGHYGAVESPDWDGFLFHEALHFEFFRDLRSGDGNVCRCILAFNLHTHKFRQLAELPRLGGPEDVAVLGDQLCVILYFAGGEREVWAIKDYGGKEELWAKLFSFSLPLRPPPRPPARPLDDPESMDTALMRRHWSDLAWADLVKRESYKFVDMGDADSCLQDATLLVPSILSVGGENREEEETLGVFYLDN